MQYPLCAPMRWQSLALLAGCASLPDDGKDAKVMCFGNLNKFR